MGNTSAKVLHVRDGKAGFLGSIGVRFMIDGAESGGGFSLVEHPGDLIFKPRNQWHTFWNAGDAPARILEIISPAGFERYFAELVELGGSRNASPQALRSLGERYRLEVDPQSIPKLLERFDLRLGEPI